MSARTWLITGATSGIGAAVAEHLGRRGDRLLLVGRSEARLTSTLERLGASGRVLVADLSRADEVDALPLDEALDGIAHIAGVLHLGKRVGPDGIDVTWATNVRGPARLVHRALEQLRPGGTIALVSGDTHRWAPVRAADLGSTGGLKAAVQCATAKLLFTRALQRRSPDHIATSFCPGRVQSRLDRGLPFWARPVARILLATGAPADEAARHVVALLDGAHPTGTYTRSGVVEPPAPFIEDEAMQDAVWDWCLHECPATPGDAATVRAPT